MRNKKTIIYIFTVVLSVLAVFILVFSNKLTQDVPIYVTVSSGDETEQIDCWISEEDEYYVFLPSYAQLSEVQIYLNTENSVSINGITLTDGMFCNSFELDVPYSLTYSAFAKSYKRSITFMKSGGVATMYIDTESGNMDYIHEKKGNEESGEISLYTAEGGMDYAGELQSINGRGNYTWGNYNKKPYSITLSNEADLLGMGQAQKWILLANAGDPSNLRNKIVYDSAKEIGLAYSPDSQWVDLYLNGEYAGLYLLCERNEVHSERVDISKDSSFLVSLEIESKLAAQNYIYVSTDSALALRVHYPLAPTDESLEAVTDTLQSLENAIVAQDGIDPDTGRKWQDIIDLDSWVRKYLIEEVFANSDAGAISQYFYYDSADASGKIFAGPVWDYDRSMGSDVAWQLTYPNTFFANRLEVNIDYSTPWLYYLYQKPEFYDRLEALYQEEFLPLINNLLIEDLDDYAKQISKASVLNQIRWFDDDETLSSQTEQICTYMTERIAFLSDVWLNDASYYLVRAENNSGTNYANYAVISGETLAYLPTFEDTETSAFIGWYYSDTDEPFDINKPIYEDTEIYAKWQDSLGNKVDNIIKLIPLAVIAVMFLVLFIADVKRMKRDR